MVKNSTLFDFCYLNSRNMIVFVCTASRLKFEMEFKIRVVLLPAKDSNVAGNLKVAENLLFDGFHENMR